MIQYIDNPTFGILLSIASYLIGIWIYKKTRISFFNPLLIGTVLAASIVYFFKIPLDVYDKGGKIIMYFLSPATVVLALPLYKRRNLLKSHFVPILVGIVVGSITAIVSVFALCKLLNVDPHVTKSLLSKSITTPIGIELTKILGGDVSLTVVSIVLTGSIGAVFAPMILMIFRIKNPVAKGIAIGTSSHAGGTSKAIEMGETEGAMGGLAIGLTGLTTAIILPILAKILF